MINPIRFGGLATGMDTDDMVKKMMAVERIKIDNVKQQKDALKFKQDTYRDLMKDFRGLYSKYLDITSNSDSCLISSKAYKTVEFDSSNSSAVTATGYADSKIGNYKVAVKQIASKAIKEIDFPNTTNKVKIGNEKFEIIVNLTGVSTAKEAAKKINTAISDNNSKSVNLEQKINVKVSSSDLALNKIIFESNDTGKNSKFKLDNTIYKGKNAIVTIKDEFNHCAKNEEFEKNSFVVDGINFAIHNDTLKKNSKTGKKSAVFIRLNSRVDENSTKELKDHIVKFVSEYNKIVDKTYTKISEKKQFKYKPLTEEQRKVMDKDQIKLWDERVKQGIIRSDSDFTSMINKLVRAFSDSVTGVGMSLKDIGINFNPDYKKPGQLVIDERKLDKSLKEHADKVKSILNQMPSKDGDYNETGILVRVKDIFYNSIIKSDCNLMKKVGFDGSITSYTNTISKQMQEKEKIIFEMEKLMQVKENKLYIRFSKLETAMNKLNQQQSYFMQQMGGGI